MYDPYRYEKYKSAAARDAAEFTPKIVQEMTWSENETVLDYGCGAGSTGFKYVLPTVEKTVSKLYSVDISDKMIEFAKKEYSHPSINYAVGNIVGEFPYENIKFDKLISIYVLHFVKDYRQALKRFHEVLKPGGTLGFTVIGQSRIFRALQDMANRDKWKSVMKGFNQYIPDWVENKEHVEDSFRVALQETGFQIQSMEFHNRTWKYPNVDELAEFYMSLNPFMKTISVDQHPELKADYLDMLQNQWKAVGEDGTVDGAYELLYVIAHKV